MEPLTIATIALLVLALFASSVAAYYLSQRSKYVGAHTVDTDSDGNFVLQRSTEHPILVQKPSDSDLSDETARLAAAGHIAKRLPVLLPTHSSIWKMVPNSLHVDPSTVTDTLSKFSVAYELKEDQALKDASGTLGSMHLLTMSHPITKVRSLSLHGPMTHTSTSATKNMVFGIDVGPVGGSTTTVKSIGFGSDLSEHAGLATEGDLNVSIRVDGSAFAEHDSHSLHGTGGLLGPADAFHVPSSETVLDLDDDDMLNRAIIPETTTEPCGNIVNCTSQHMPEIHMSLSDTDMTTVTLKKGAVLYAEFYGPLIHQGVGTVRDAMAAVGLNVKSASS